MIANCVITLAVVSQICAYKYNQESISYAKPEQSVTNNFRYSYQPTQVMDKYSRIAVKSSSHNLGHMKSPIPAGPATRNVVARGRYPITLQNSGPVPDKKIPVVTSHLRAPVQEKPTVRLQAKIPAPKTIAHTCTCYKTIVKPRVQQHLISVPTIQRYIETLHRPVVENIHYEAYPVRCLDSSNEEQKVSTYQVQSVNSANALSQKNTGIPNFEYSTEENYEFSKPEKTPVMEIPRIQFSEGDKTQTIKIPRVQFIQDKKPVELVQGIELPRVRFLESQKSEAFVLPQTQFLENKKPQFVEILNTQFLENNKAESVQLPRVEFLQAQKLQTVEIPRIQVEESPKVQTVEIPHQEGTITLGSSPFTYQTKH